jgi:hypothetical protein
MDTIHISILEKSYRDQIKDINTHMTNLSNTKTDLEKKLLQFLRNAYCHVYVIRAVPTGTRNLSHYVGCFSTELQAQKFIPPHSFSCNPEEGITWYYSVHKVESVIVSDSELMIMDQSPLNFPYTG